MKQVEPFAIAVHRRSPDDRFAGYVIFSLSDCLEPTADEQAEIELIMKNVVSQIESGGAGQRELHFYWRPPIPKNSDEIEDRITARGVNAWLPGRRCILISQAALFRNKTIH